MDKALGFTGIILMATLLLGAGQMKQVVVTSKPPSASGGSGTITFVTGGANAGSGISPTGQATGDLLLVTQTMNSASPTAALSVTSGCSSSGTFAGANISAGGNSVQNSGLWCIASSATPVFSATNCSASCRTTYYAFHSTNGWNTGSFVQGTAAVVSDANPVVGVSVVVPGSAFLVFGQLAQQATVETLSASSPWSLGAQSAGGQVNCEAYQINVGAATYSPACGRNTASATSWVSMSVAMSTN